MRGCTKVITAIGYTRNQLPEIMVDGRRLQEAGLSHDRQGGAIIPGRLFGAGIAFPEEVVDRELGIREVHTLHVSCVVKSAAAVCKLPGSMPAWTVRRAHGLLQRAATGRAGHADTRHTR